MKPKPGNSHWYAGVPTALAGAALARICAGNGALHSTGCLLAIMGLFWIGIGISRNARVRARAADIENSANPKIPGG